MLWSVAEPPVMRCAGSVMAAVDERTVSLVCHVSSSSPLSEARITWDGQQQLQPTVRSGWPPGVKFDRDDEYMAYLRQVNFYRRYSMQLAVKYAFYGVTAKRERLSELVRLLNVLLCVGYFMFDLGPVVPSTG